MAILSTSIAPAIEEFIRREHQIPDNDPLYTRDAHLFESGFVDSLGFTQLIAFIESTFEMTFDVEHLFSEEFTTINGISEVIHARLNNRQAKSSCANP